ncbi:MAG: hypothetical protein ABR555_18750 [Pyrinomonadaceae bacterium]
MNSELVERIIHALLYEGSVLYPYRPSSIKNQQRWNFGVLTPKAFSDAHQGTEAWMMQTECLVRNPNGARITIDVRFLQLVSRPIDQAIDRMRIQPNADMKTADSVAEAWVEPVERNFSTTVDLTELTIKPRRFSFQLPGKEETKTLEKASNQDQLHITQEQALEGCVEISAKLLTPQLSRLRVRIKNLMHMTGERKRTRGEMLLYSFISTHTIFNIQNGEFVSLLDPPEDLREISAESKNIGCWPVLVGEAGERNSMLSAPIILYDYPQVAPESAGDFYDSTEIDEMLTLRVLTLTNKEKVEIREGDDFRARQVLERAEALPWEHLARVHGAVRGLAPIKDESLD